MNLNSFSRKDSEDEQYDQKNESLSSSSHYSQIENEVKIIQDAILSQGQEIEQFIQRKKNNQKLTDEFEKLQSLFELFKSEIKMNLSLRSALLTEKSKFSSLFSSYSAFDTNLQQFLSFFSKQVGTDVTDLNTAAQILVNIINSSKEIEQLRKENQIFQNQIQEMKQKFEYNQAQNAIEIAKYISLAESARGYQEDLKNTRSLCTSIQNENNNLQAKLLTLSNENSALRQQLNERGPNQIEDQRNKLIEYQQIIQQKEQKLSEYESVLIAAQKKLNENEKKNQNQNEEILNAKEKIIELRDKVCHLEEYQQQLIEEIQSRSIAETKKAQNQVGILQEKLSNIQIESSQLSNENQRLRVQLRQSLRVIHNLEEETTRLQVQLEQYPKTNILTNYCSSPSSSFQSDSDSHIDQDENDHPQKIHYPSKQKRANHDKNQRNFQNHIINTHSRNGKKEENSLEADEMNQYSSPSFSSSTQLSKVQMQCDKLFNKIHPTQYKVESYNPKYEPYSHKRLKEEVISLKNELATTKESFSASSL